MAAAVAARGLRVPANRLVALFLATAAYWSLCEVLWTLALAPGRALVLARASTPGSLLLAPLALHLFLLLRPEIRARFPWILPLSYASALGFGAVGALTGWIVADVKPVPWGFSPVLGPGVAWAYAAVAGLPCAVGLAWVVGAWRSGSLRRRSRRLEMVSLGPLVVASLTDFVLPSAGVHVPRLGSASIAVWGFVVWWTVYRARNPILTPGAFAREIIDALPEGVALLRRDGTIRATNARLAELAGTSRRDLLGRHVREILEGRSRQPSGVSEEHQCDLVAASGLRIPVSVAATGLRDREGNPIGRVLVLRDLGELASLRSRLLTAGRLAAVGQLASGIAHEINNPTAYVHSNLRQLQRHWEAVGEQLRKARCGPAAGRLLAEGARALRESAHHAERVAEIVREVRASSRSGFESDVADVNALLDTAVRMAGPRLRRIRVEDDRRPLPPVAGAPQELLHVFLELVANAREAVGPAGRIRLATRREGDGVLVRVEDDGCGIAPETLERVFDPFFTTGRPGESAGLGLAIAHQIVTRHGGEIRVDSALGRGTRVSVELPAIAEPAPAVEGAA